MAPVLAPRRLHMLFCIGGILGSLLLYGVLQERIMAVPFGGEPFKHSLLLVLCNRLTTCAVSVVIIAVKGLDAQPQAPLFAYAAISLSNVIATTCQYEALRYLTFPLQTLAKCAKMLPVMLWGAAILRKSYKLQDYASAATITLGCALFPLTGSVSAKAMAKHSGLHTTGAGVALMLTYLAFDGFTSTWQDRLFKGTRMSIYNQSLYVTLVSAALSFSGLVTSGQLVPALSFVGRHPDVLASIFALSLAATLGQLFITHTIRSYGALLFATVMTTRQFLSILLSSALFRHPLSPGQWASTVIVFGALQHRAFTKRRSIAQPVRSKSGRLPAGVSGSSGGSGGSVMGSKSGSGDDLAAVEAGEQHRSLSPTHILPSFRTAG